MAVSVAFPPPLPLFSFSFALPVPLFTVPVTRKSGMSSYPPWSRRTCRLSSSPPPTSGRNIEAWLRPRFPLIECLFFHFSAPTQELCEPRFPQPFTCFHSEKRSPCADSSTPGTFFHSLELQATPPPNSASVTFARPSMVAKRQSLHLPPLISFTSSPFPFPPHPSSSHFLVRIALRAPRRELPPSRPLLCPFLLYLILPLFCCVFSGYFAPFERLAGYFVPRAFV